MPHKVERVIHEYDVAEIGADLEARWTDREGDRASLRDLADDLNRRLLRSALRDAGVDATEADIDSYYRQLTDEDALRATKAQIRRRLEDAGVPIDAVESDFVSHQSVYTYLTEVRDASLEDVDDTEQVETVTERIQRLRGRVEVVTRRELTTLANTERITLGEFDVLSSVRVLCRTCGEDYEVTELLQGGGCDCEKLQT